MSLSPDGFNYIRALLQERTANVLDDDKAYLVETRLLPLARAHRFRSVDDLVSRLRAGAGLSLQQQVIEALFISETYFFRDWHPFEVLRQTILPELVRRREAERRLHIWSAACSIGQEPYSLAMLLREYFPALDGWHVRLIASDLSATALERARQGCYSQMEVGRGLPPELLAKYFEKEGDRWQIKPAIRCAVDFRAINLSGLWPALPSMDLILLRNVLIYLDIPTKKQILAKVRSLLRPDGYLLLGGAETTHNLDEGFEQVAFERVSYSRLRSG